MAASDAKFVPIKNQAYRVYIPMRYTNGDAIAGLATFDSGLASGSGKALILKDGGAAANSTNNVSVGASGYNWYLDLTASEMNADGVVVIFRSTTADVQDGLAVLYPEPRGLRDLAFPTVSGRDLSVADDGSVTVGALLADVITAASIAANAIGAAEVADNFITAAKIATDALDGDALAASFVSELAAGLPTTAQIADAVWDEAMVEPSGVPAVTASARATLAWLLALSRNKRTQTATTETLRNDADSANIATSTKADDGTTFTRGEYA